MDDRLPEAKVFAQQSPNLVRLAKEGMRFSDFYVSCPRCTPARATFLTGISAAKLGMTYVNEGGEERRGQRTDGGGGGGGGGAGAGKAGGGKGGGGGGGAGGGGGRKRAADAGPADMADPATRKLIPPSSSPELGADVKTVADVLLEAGYATAHFGKWHVGRQLPSKHGFDLQDGANTNQGPGHAGKPNPEQGVAITDRGIEFVRAQAAAKKPFYLQLSHYGGGSEDEARAETRQALADELRGMRGKTAYQAAILRDVDDHIGRVLQAIEDLGLSDSTYVVVSFDHGASGRNSNAPLSGGKGSVLEGGIRVPFLVRGPGIAAGVCSHVRASGADLLPTLADLAQVKSLPVAIEGGSLVSLLKGNGVGEVKRPREELVIHFPHYDLSNGGPASAIFIGNYKLIRRYEDGARMLFDVVKDPGERNDLAASDKKRVEEMEKRLDAYLADIKAAMPRPNPEYGKEQD
jgi:arylsulfatase A-like enzyme